jgi:uncharacterized membrane protein HdeD (DUF308 family)
LVASAALLGLGLWIVRSMLRDGRPLFSHRFINGPLVLCIFGVFGIVASVIALVSH